MNPRQIRPIYVNAPKAHDTSQRETIDPIRYAAAIEGPTRKPRPTKALVVVALLLLGTAIVGLTR